MTARQSSTTSCAALAIVNGATRQQIGIDALGPYCYANVTIGRVFALLSLRDRALDIGEGERIARAMKGADIVFLGNHGVVVCGARIDHAYDELYYLERACQVQVLAASTGQPLLPVDAALAQRVAEQAMGERLQAELFFEALRRTL